MANSRRLQLQAILEEILGSRNVYFQPPATVQMSYPAIVYSLDDIDDLHADDAMYMRHKVYQIIFVHTDPDSDIIEAITDLQFCTYVRMYTADNLYHDVFSLYY